jgi:hypothetical protein
MKTLRSDTPLKCNMCNRKQRNWKVWFPEMTLDDRLCGHCVKSLVEPEITPDPTQPERIVSILSTDSETIINTNLQTIEIGISNYQSCCESWGHFESHNDLNYFVDADFLGIRLTDTELITTDYPNGHGLSNQYVECGGVQFVDIQTSRGVFQVAVYNFHNGYYGHNIWIRSNQLTYEGRL